MGHSRGRSVGSAELWAVGFESSVAGDKAAKRQEQQVLVHLWALGTQKCHVSGE